MIQGHDDVPVGGSDSIRRADVTAVGTESERMRAPVHVRAVRHRWAASHPFHF